MRPNPLMPTLIFLADTVTWRLPARPCMGNLAGSWAWSHHKCCSAASMTSRMQWLRRNAYEP